MLARLFVRERKGAVTVLFAAGVIPMVGLVGLAVDYGIWNQTNATLSVAANVAAMTAVKVAANAQLAADPSYETQGKAAAYQWFASEVGSDLTHVGTTPLTLDNGGKPHVDMNFTTTVSATVTYSGTVNSIFGNILFFRPTYNIAGTAQASISFAPYLNVEMMLDNSSSMDIGATVADMQTLQHISACDASNAYYPAVPNKPVGGGVGNSLDPYNSYEYTGSGETYADYTDQYGSFFGPIATTPVVLTPPATGSAPISLAQGGNTYGPQCIGYPSVYGTVNGQPNIPYAGPPCEFACHWDGAHGNSGNSQDLYGAARRTINQPNQVTLRFDLVKRATNQILQTMQTDDLAIGNLKVGIFTFNNQLNRVYPTSGDASDGWGDAIAAVGLPPSGPYVEETGILPVIGLRQNVPNDDTNIVSSMNTLQNNILTKVSGDGTTPDKPRRVLFMITDGFMDDNNQGRSAFPSTLCSYLKNTLGYTIYVVFTPYYPIMHEAYLGGYGTIINSPSGVYTDQGTLAYGLAQCASSPADIISAQSQSDLNKALQKFLQAALTTPAKFTQ
jgi:Flp pilus assembly protein TadG